MEYVSFFSGALGLDLGLEEEGLTPLLYCEVDKYCQQTISKNRPNVPLVKDILDYSAKDIRRVIGFSDKKKLDLVVGGPPCQAFSTAGSRKAFKDERGNVFIKFLEIATELNPDYIIIENVRGLLSTPIQELPEKYKNEFDFIELSKKGSVIQFVYHFLVKNGYQVSFNLYNAFLFGVPQSRERVVITASKHQKLSYLTPTNSFDLSFDLPEPIPVKNVIFELDHDKNNEFILFPEKRLKFLKMLKSGQNWTNLPTEELKEEALGKAYFLGGGKTGFLRRLSWDKPSPTLVTNPCMPATNLAHPEKDRPLTILEYAKIQQFPEDWIFCGTTLQKYKQIGNAVPVGLGKAIGKLLLDDFNGIEREIFNQFKYSRYKNTTEKDLLMML